MNKHRSNYTPPDDLPTVGGSYTRVTPGAEPVRVPSSVAVSPALKTLSAALSEVARRNAIATTTDSPSLATKPARK